MAILQRDPRDIVACLSYRDEQALRARLEQQLQQQAVAGGPQRRPEMLVSLPLDRRLPGVVVVTRQAAQLAGCRFVVRVDSWERTSRCADSRLPRAPPRAFWPSLSLPLSPSSSPSAPGQPGLCSSFLSL